jgi:plasmid stabilization system protein ParE
MSVRLLEPAQAELEEAITWYAGLAPGLGDAFLIETLKSIQLIEKFPQAWHPLMPHIRRCRLRRFPYSVVYTLEGDDLLVLAIAHQHRKPGYWRNRLN